MPNTIWFVYKNNSIFTRPQKYFQTSDFYQVDVLDQIQYHNYTKTRLKIVLILWEENL